MAAVTTFFGEAPGTPVIPALHRSAPRAAIARDRRSPLVYWRRRLAVVGLALGLVVVAAQAGDALGGSPLTAPERRPVADVVEVTARPGDTVWALVARAFPGQDPRTRVDAVVEARHGAPLQVGERVQIPR